MKESRGRYNQYKILFNDEKLRKNLLKTELLSKQSLSKMLNDNEPIIIKSVYGTEIIRITYMDGQYKLQRNNIMITIQDQEELYSTLTDKMTQRYYIIQKSPNSNLFRQFITMQRNVTTDEWSIASKTKIDRNTFTPLKTKIDTNKVKHIVTQAAKQLGCVFSTCYTIVLEIVCDRHGNVWIYDSNLHFPNSKWSQYHILSRKRMLRKYLPDTDLLTPDTFHQFLQRFKNVILKPCIGQNGTGVIQISKKSDSCYEIHEGIQKIIKSNQDETFEYIKNTYLIKREYIVQQRLALATIDNCPIDIRIVTQKNNKAWKVTGKIVKVAADQFVITNAAQKLLTLEQAILEANITRFKPKKLHSQMNKICLLASKILEITIEELNIIGFDIGITKNGALWIIESNKNPDIQMFDELDDKTIYKTILEGRKTKK